jgi:hypothetical protein
MQDSKTLFAVLDPMKLLGPSAFGPLKVRPVTSDGIVGDWQPLVTLVRVPTFKGMNCPSDSEKQCMLTGEKLFLLDSVSTNVDFANSVPIPEGFAQNALAVPATKEKTLYIKLRDDPSTVSTVTLPANESQP